MKCGLGVRPELFEAFFTDQPELDFIEAHSENYFGASVARAKLLELRQDYALSLHGVGLSLGRADDLDVDHLAALKSLVDEFEPLLVSEHLAWSAYAHQHVPDLLPLPLSQAALEKICQHIDQMQSALGRAIVLENPSNYLLFDQLQIDEAEFLNTVAAKTGCGLLLDLNNLYVSAQNLGRDASAYLQAIDSRHIAQYHIAGHCAVERPTDAALETVLIDSHNQPVSAAVWDLYDQALQRHGGRPTVLEWDSDFPDFAVLLQQCDIADRILAERPVVLNQLQPRAVQENDRAGCNVERGEPSLAHTQQQFLHSLLARSDSLESAQSTYQQRLGIYQNNVFGACYNYLVQVYPATMGVVGDAFFRQLVNHHLQSEAPAAGNLALYGARLVNSLGHFESLKELPYLADLLRFEWALHSAYFADTNGALRHADYSQQALLHLALQFNPSVTLLESAYPLFEIHRQSLPAYQAEVELDLAQAQDTLLVFKQAHRVQHEVLGSAQAALLVALSQCSNLGQALELAAQTVPPEQLSQALNEVFARQLLQLAE